MLPSLTLKNSMFCPQCEFVCSTWSSKHIEITSLQYYLIRFYNHVCLYCVVQIKSSIQYETHHPESLRPKALQILRFSGFCVTQQSKIEHVTSTIKITYFLHLNNAWRWITTTRVITSVSRTTLSFFNTLRRSVFGASKLLSKAFCNLLTYTIWCSNIKHFC